MTRRTRDLPTLTGIRGIAALAVVLFHIRHSMAGFAPSGVIAVLAQGYLAVDLFFMLSGFILWWTYGAAFAEGGRAAILPFIVRRFARIFPLHLAIMAAMTGFALLLLASGRPLGAQYPLGELPAQLLLVHNWGLADRLSWNDPAWSISAEWAAYLLLALMGGWAARWRVGAWGLPLLTAGIAGALGAWFAATGRTGIGMDIAQTGLARCLAEFMIGILLCQWWMAVAGQRALVAGTAMLLGAVGALLIAGGWSQPAGVPLVMAAILIAGLEASVAGRPPLAGRTALWLGRISYALYLSHFFLWIVFKLAFVSDAANVPPLAIAAYLVIALATAHALHRWVELPGRRGFQRLAEALLERRGGAARA